MESNTEVPVRLLIFVIGSMILMGAEKPSPFTARTSAPAVAPAAPVSPVVPTSLLRAARPRPFVATGLPSVAAPPAGVAPVSRPALNADLPTPPPVAQKPQLQTQVLPVPEMVVAQIRPPQVSDIETGVSRNQVVAKLGNPSTAISMYDDGRFVESLRYDWKGKWLGTVRLIDGRVARIDQP